MLKAVDFCGFLLGLKQIPMKLKFSAYYNPKRNHQQTDINPSTPFCVGSMSILVLNHRLYW
jgi:hypothetical protein